MPPVIANSSWATVHQLRSLWKPHKERLQALRQDHPTTVRFHRACSWLQRVETMSEQDADFVLISQWIAFNSLYGQWDAHNHEPIADRECWRVFMMGHLLSTMLLVLIEHGADEDWGVMCYPPIHRAVLR